MQSHSNDQKPFYHLWSPLNIMTHCWFLYDFNLVSDEWEHETACNTVGERMQCYSLNRLLTLEVCLTCSISIFLHSFFSFFSFPWHPFVSLNKAVNQPPLSIPFLYITSHFPNHVEFGTTWVEEWRWRLSVFPTAEIVGVSRGKHNIAGWDWLWRGGDMSPSGAPHDR